LLTEINRINGLSRIFLYNVPADWLNVPGVLRTNSCGRACYGFCEAKGLSINKGGSLIGIIIETIRKNEQKN
jgi:hypothetical protein